MTPVPTSFSYRPFRLEIRGDLMPLDPLRIGTGERLSLATDSPLLLDDASGSPYIPGSSLRGVLRDHLEREAPLVGCGQAEIDSLFGPTGESAVSWSGRLAVFDAYSSGADLAREVRDHVRLNPKWGAADSRAKFDAEAALPAAGSSFAVCLVYEGDDVEDRELILMGEAIRFLESGEARIGAKSGIGYGRVRLQRVTFAEFDRSQPSGLASYLAARLGRLPATTNSFFFGPREKTKTNNSAHAFSALTFGVRLHFEGPVLIKAPIPPLRQAGGNPADPQTYAQTGLWEADNVFLNRASDNRYYLPGASIRGVLRSQALRIDGVTGTEVTDTLFGWTKSRAETGAKGLIEIGDGELVGEPVAVFLDHVAIDRITAAAVDLKKFSQSALASPKFDISIRIQFRQDEEQTKAVRLAAFLLRDLMGGRFWAGSGVSRGYGYIRSAELLSVRGDLLDSLQWQPPDASASRPGRVAFDQTGVFQFADPALAWLWQRVDPPLEIPG